VFPLYRHACLNDDHKYFAAYTVVAFFVAFVSKPCQWQRKQFKRTTISFISKASAWLSQCMTLMK
jgi:hypothetical protein